VSKASEVKQSIAVSRSDSLLHRPCPWVPPVPRDASPLHG
jgi:hypothetical protein